MIVELSFRTCDSRELRSPFKDGMETRNGMVRWGWNSHTHTCNHISSLASILNRGLIFHCRLKTLQPHHHKPIRSMFFVIVHRGELIDTSKIFSGNPNLLLYNGLPANNVLRQSGDGEEEEKQIE